MLQMQMPNGCIPVQQNNVTGFNIFGRRFGTNCEDGNGRTASFAAS